MSGKGESPTSPRRLLGTARRLHAVTLRVAGMGYLDIAKSPAIPTDPNSGPLYPGDNGHKRACEDVQRAMRDSVKQTHGKANVLRAMELARLDALQVSIWPQTRPRRRVMCPDTQQLGCKSFLWREVDPQATNTAIRILERRSKYLRLDLTDAPDGDVEVTDQQVAVFHEAIMQGMERAGLSPEVQQEVLEHAGDFLREQDAVTDDDV